MAAGRESMAASNPDSLLTELAFDYRGKSAYFLHLPGYFVLSCVHLYRYHIDGAKAELSL